MLRLVHRRSAAAVFAARVPPRASLCPAHTCLVKPRFLSTGLMNDGKNITFTPKDAVRDLDAGLPVPESLNQSAVTEIDLTQFLAPDPSTLAAAGEAAEKIGQLTATDIGLTWWCPTGSSSDIMSTKF